MDRPGGLEGDGIPRLGSVFGRYRIDAVLGRGGMGVVFRATDLRLDRPVALKVLSQAVADDPDYRRRFERESRLAASIDHPAILTIFEADAVGSTLYIAMRLVDGPDLATILRRDAPLPTSRTLAILSHIGDALDAAHERGLVHRDVKPANILLERRGDRELAYLTDFGIARPSSRSVDDPSRMAGSIATLSPEVISGGPATGAADQYALACVAYECLTGTAPFDGPTDAARLYAHLTAPMPEVRTSGTVLLDEHTAGQVDGVLRRALAKPADQRFPSCTSFVDALRSASGADAVTPLPSDQSARPRASAARSAPSGIVRRAVVVAAAGVAAVLLSGVIWLVRPPGAASPSPPPDAADAGIRSPATGAPSPSGGVATPGADTGPATGRPSATLPARIGPIRQPQDLDEWIVFSAFNEVTDGFDLYRVRPDSDNLEPVVSGSADERMPAVSPDGSLLAYVVGAPGSRDVWLLDVLSGESRPLVVGPTDDLDPAWAPDGRTLAFTRSDGTDSDLWLLALDEDEVPEVWLDEASEDSQPSWSPDGRHLAFISDRSGRRLSWIAPLDGPMNASRATLGGSREAQPRWTADARLVLTRMHLGDEDAFLAEDPFEPTTPTRLTLSPVRDIGASPSTDGSAVAWVTRPFSGEEGPGGLFIRSLLSGPGPDQLVMEALGISDPAWGRDP